MDYITNFSQSDNYRKIIHNLIPGGCHTYSKGDDQFPLLSPAAITHGKGAYVWDVDGNRYIDCTMGLTSISLGHAYDAIDEKVIQEIRKGVNFSRPSVLEKEIAEKFLNLVPIHNRIKFAKNGSCVTTAAVKLARAYTGRKLVAFPHDHPFYSYDDWFIGRTPCDRGIPEEIKNLSVTFKSYDLDSLKGLIKKFPNQIACVISEPEVNTGVSDDYLKNAYELMKSEGIVSIADEMKTGFKTDFPGTLSKYNLRPDLATWGKGIANGYSFCALTGIKEIMDIGGITSAGEEKLFLISTTHGGETHGIAACLATIEEFKKHNVIAHNHLIGDSLIKQVRALITKKGLEKIIEITDCNWLIGFQFKNDKFVECMGLKTLFCQEMIKRGVLFQGLFVPCFSHTEKEVKYIADAIEESLDIYSKALNIGYKEYLVGSPIKPVFRKYL